MPSELLSFKASPQLKARITELSEQRGLNRSAAIKAAVLEASGSDGGGDRAELWALLWESARGGNVTAMKEIGRIMDVREKDQGQGEDVLDELDELARRRA